MTVLAALSTLDVAEIVFVALLVLVAAALAASETAITRMTRIRAYRLAEEGRRGGRAMVRIADDPASYLNVILFLTLLVQLGGTTLAGTVAVRHLHQIGEVVSTVVMTLVLFVFAEVTPKTFVVQNSDRAGLRLAPLIVAIKVAVGPVAKGLIRIANVIMPGRGLPHGPFVTEQEIRAMAEVASDESSIEEGEKELIHSIFEFGDTLVREVMVPRPDMVAAPIDAGVPKVLDLMLKHGYSRIPVYRDTLDEIEGVVYAKDLLRHLHAGKPNVPIRQIMREAYFVPETKRVADLLREMQQRRVHIALVLDEYGSVAGLVTIEDLIEELVGEIADEYDVEEALFELLDDDTYRVTGRLPIDELNDLLDVELPHDEWDTVAGLVYGLLGSVPVQGETVSFGDLEFTVEKVQGRRIEKVLVRRTHPAEVPEGAGG